MIDYDEMTERSKLKRASNRESSAGVLMDRGISFTAHNKGAHLIVEAVLCGAVFDFWPGTGKFIRRGNGETGRGVFNLIKKIKALESNEADALETDADREMIGDDADYGLGPIGFK